MFRYIINAQSIPLKVYTPLTEENIDGVVTKTYRETTIQGVFHPQGNSLNRGDMFNTREEKYEFIITNDYHVNLEDLILYHNNYYRVVESNLWTQYGFRTFSCSLATINKEKLIIKEFVNELPKRVF